MFRLGVHVSIAGGLLSALKEALKLDCTSMQIFLRNPRGYRRREFLSSEIEEFHKIRRQKNIYPLVVHAGYIVNLASSQKKIRSSSIQLVREDLELSNRIGADMYLIHFGSHKDRELGLGLMNDSLAQILKKYKGRTLLVLENTAGEGNRLGASLDEMSRILSNEFRIGFCLDSAHLFSAGYDLRRKKVLDELAEEIEQKIGFEKLKLLHLNDSYFEFGSRKDRHQHIGSGFIGEKAFKQILNHPGFKDLPVILETPRSKLEDDIQNLNRVKYLKQGRKG